ncbi:MAG: carboxypeptidase regulatory-like domain-containing protein [Chloroflexi bacterium]|nr:carboxypeptidase regulatory-like domain-containing protein [Chloroflexota bacterium]
MKALRSSTKVILALLVALSMGLALTGAGRFVHAQEASGGSATIQITDGHGSPVEGATVEVYDASGALVGTGTTDRTGRASFGGLARGTYEASARSGRLTGSTSFTVRGSERVHVAITLGQPQVTASAIDLLPQPAATVKDVVGTQVERAEETLPAVVSQPLGTETASHNGAARAANALAHLILTAAVNLPGQTTVQGTETRTVYTGAEQKHYRICNDAASTQNVVVQVGGRAVETLRPGDCVDVRGNDIRVQGTTRGGTATVRYERLD